MSKKENPEQDFVITVIIGTVFACVFVLPCFETQKKKPDVPKTSEQAECRYKDVNSWTSDDEKSEALAHCQEVGLGRTKACLQMKEDCRKLIKSELEHGTVARKIFNNIRMKNPNARPLRLRCKTR